ncbi:MAG: hypothetical protein M1164_00755 [Candidatus Marsarchaeota archaeon]|jgi:hypothetical protein|nr:hypothetical protein [Candidatus Marsarchaeota archaeon]
MENTWSDYTDAIVSNMDGMVKSKYGVSLRDLLSDPSSVASKEGVADSIKRIKEDVDAYLDELAESMGPERKRVEDGMSKASAITQQLAQNVSMQSKQYKVPLAKPVVLDRKDDDDTKIYVDSVDQGVLSIIEKLVSSSTMIFDQSYKYKDYSIGSWLFSGAQAYSVTVYTPTSEYISLEYAREELETLLDAAYDYLSK